MPNVDVRELANVLQCQLDRWARESRSGIVACRLNINNKTAHRGRIILQHQVTLNGETVEAPQAAAAMASANREYRKEFATVRHGIIELRWIYCLGRVVDYESDLVWDAPEEKCG